MAINVYLVFFRRYDAHMLRRLYWIYGVICYGLPLIPAMFCLLYSDERKGKMYGDATVSLNCSKNQDILANQFLVMVLDQERMGSRTNIFLLRSNLGRHPACITHLPTRRD